MKALPLLLLLITGCATYKTHNQTTTGKVVMRGGIHGKESWDDKLVFKRMSWYYGMTLFFDVLIYKADPASPFSKWFSKTEKEYFNKCENLLVTVAYSADTSKISHVSFREQMKFNGYDDVVINTFASSLKTHPSSQEWRTLNYKVLGYCKRAPTRLNSNSQGISFPSFKFLEIDL